MHIRIDNSIINTGTLDQTTNIVTHKAKHVTNSNKTFFSDEYNFESKGRKEEHVMTGKEALKKYDETLTNYEKGEILYYPQIYFLGNKSKKVLAPELFSDSKGYYTVILSDHIAYRYEILQYIGKGSFGQALKCFDHKEKKVVALKILRSKKKLYHQGMVEAKMLKFIKDHDTEGRAHIVKIVDYFLFRKHIMIVTELLSINLYTFLEKNNFQGISLGLIKRFARQIIDTLCFLRKHQIIHCDLKPENILLEHPNRSAIKLIDFGSSCFSNEKIYTYIQSRFYRAPEIMLGIPYTTGIDMWSTGCILSELYTGYPLFPGKNQLEQMAMIMQVNGIPPHNVLTKATRFEFFFKSDRTPIEVKDSKGEVMVPGSKSLSMLMKSTNEEFVDFVRKCLVWDPEKRMAPEEAKKHPWLRISPNTFSSNKKNATINLTSKVKMRMNGSFITKTERNKQEVEFKDLKKPHYDTTKAKRNERKKVRLKVHKLQTIETNSKKHLPRLENSLIQIIAPRTCKLSKTLINKLLS